MQHALNFYQTSCGAHAQHRITVAHGHTHTSNAHVRVDMFLGPAIGIIDWPQLTVCLVRYVRWENFLAAILCRSTSSKFPFQPIDLCPSLITITRGKCKASQLSDKEAEPWATPTLDCFFQTGILDTQFPDCWIIFYWEQVDAESVN